MRNKTKIIAIEGIDGSGKTLQAQRIAQTLRNANYSVCEKSFPDYDSFFGKSIGELLNGEKIRADKIDSKSMSLWYALDRWENFKEYVDGETDFLIINRYVLSNAVYQSIRQIDIANDDENNFDWVMKLEHEKFGLPKPDLYLVLDVEQNFAQTNVDKKKARDYVDGRDVYESQAGLLARAREKYRLVSQTNDNIALIKCMKQKNVLFTPEEIAKKIFETICSRKLID